MKPKRPKSHSGNIGAKKPKPQAQLKYIRDLMRVYAVVEAMTGKNGLHAMFLLRSEPIKAFGNKTADALIREGRADDVIAYIESIAGGAAG